MADTTSPNRGRATASASGTSRSPRRIVRLTGDEHSEIAEVLREYKDGDVSGKRLHEDLRQLADAHRGTTLAAEWHGPLGWTRFLWLKR